MNKILPILSIILCCLAFQAVEINCTFDKKLPPGVTVNGTIQQENGVFVKVNNKNYVAATIAFNGEENTAGILDLDLATFGTPQTKLGIILYRRAENKKLVPVSTLTWMKTVPSESFGQMTFKFAPGTFQKDTEYQIYLFRANQKGTLKIRKISFKTQKIGHSITMNYKKTPDLVGPLAAGPSGKPDFHIQITGVNPAKSIKEIVVTRPGCRWVSGDDVKKNYWMLQYYDSSDFPARKNPKNNFNGTLHKNLSCIDMVFESVNPPVSDFLCEVFYSDGTVDSWKYEVKKESPSPAPLTLKKNVLNINNNYSIPASWKQPQVSGRSFHSLLSDKENLKDGLIMRGKAHRRLWSPGWFLPYAGHNRNPAKSQVEKFCKTASRTALREIQLFDENGKNIAAQAVISGECESPWLDLKKAVDNDISLDSAAKAADPSINRPQSGTITLSFDKPVKISKAVLYHGCRNGNAAGWIANDFVLESLVDNKYQTIENCNIKNNKSERTEHTFSNLTTNSLRLRITKPNTLIDFGKFDWSFNNKYLNIAKAGNVPDDVTFHFWYLGHDSTIYFALPEKDYTPPGIEEFKKWHAAHPNFMGFQITEFDNDLRHTHGWGQYRDYRDAINSYNFASKNFVVRRPLLKLPDSRQEALKQYEDIFKLYQRMMFGAAANFSEVSIWHHQPMAWGAISTVMECFGGGCPVFSSQIAAARGASRQFGNKPWGCYFATYLGNGYLNYLKKGKVYGPDCGKSVSLYRRQNYYNYLSGASFADFEHPDIAFVKEKIVKGKEPVLSPHGKAVLEVAEFARNDKERGDVYTPIALLLDFAHGWDSHESRKVWYGMFKPVQADRNIDVWMKGIFGNSELHEEGYGCNMSQTGFSGLVDILVLNPPQGPAQNLQDYPAAIVAGDIKWNASIINAVKKYVSDGGILVINSEQLPKDFNSEFTGVEFSGKTAKDKTIVTTQGEKLSENEIPYEYHIVKSKGAEKLLQTSAGNALATVFDYGKGKVILTLQKYLIEDPATAGAKKGLSTVHYLLSLLRHELLPFTISGDSPAEVVVNRLKNGWRISLLNNRGVYKQPLTAPIVNNNEKTVQTITFPQEFKFADERITNKKLAVKNKNGKNQLDVTIPAGDLTVIDIVSKQ